MLIAMAVIVLAAAPWSVRNTKNFGHFVSMTTSDGVNLWMGNNANSDGYYMPQPATIRGLGEYDQNKILMEDALLYITEHPGTFVLRSITKAGLAPCSRDDSHYLEHGRYQASLWRKCVVPVKVD